MARAVLFASLPLLWAGQIPALSALTLAAVILLLFVMLREPGQRARNLVFLPVFALIPGAEIALCLWGGRSFALPICALWLTLLNASAMRGLCGGAAREEMRARLHV